MAPSLVTNILLSSVSHGGNSAFNLMNKPIIAITMGDPAGVGPELALKALAEPSIESICSPVILGDISVLKSVATRLKLPLPATVLGYRQWVDRSVAQPDRPTVVDFNAIQMHDFQPRVVNATTGRASFQYFDAAISAAMDGRVDAIATCPIHKEAINQAGYCFPGHTEILASRVDSQDYCMMLTSETISCGFVTTHVGYHEVPDLLSIDRITKTIQLTHDALCKIRGRAVRLCCCSLNPHGGENGLFGNLEEERLIQPAVDWARERDIVIDGPLPPDTAFLADRRCKTDGYICMYHDQGHIPLKALAFEDAVNITLGLPVLRTSVDHGTDCDIAWEGVAGVSSLLEAIRLAARLAD